MTNCLFCKISSGEIPSHTLYEDEDFRVILDINPLSRGHALVIPKEHCSGIFDIPDNLAAKVLPLAKKAAYVIKQTLEADGVNLLQNNGAAAGQEIEHFHLHIIPRYKGDGLYLVHGKGNCPRTAPDGSVLAEMAEGIKQVWE